MNVAPHAVPRALRLAGCVAACLALAAGARAQGTEAGHADAPVVAAGFRDGAAILEPVPIDAGAPPVPSSPVGRAPADPRAVLVVCALAAAVILVRFLPRRNAADLPEGVFAVLGEAPLAGTHTVRVVRFGPKTILLGLCGSSCTTLAEIDDAAVTAAIVADCRGEVRSSARMPAAAVRFPASLRAALGNRAGGVS